MECEREGDRERGWGKKEREGELESLSTEKGRTIRKKRERE